MDDRRRFPRAPLTVPVDLRVASFGELVQDRTADISEGGFFIATTKLRDIGEEVWFRIVTEREGGVIEGTARVARVVDASESRAAGIGLEFLVVEEPSLSMLHALVAMSLKVDAT